MTLQISVAILTSFLVGYFGFNFLELFYARVYSKPLVVHNHLFLRKLKPEQQELIENMFPFYAKLTPKKKRVFQHRVLNFIEDKEFIGIDGVQITAEIQILVASVAVMITFGMRRYLIESVSKIIIYPSQYYSEWNKNYHLGEYNPFLKAIVLSWEDFKRGLLIKDDNKNLGIHEFAHALNFNATHFKDTSSILFADGLQKMERLVASKDFIEKLNASNYLREYAKTNKFEFFAVCLEHFVETPEQFKKELPELYTLLQRMMNFAA